MDFNFLSSVMTAISFVVFLGIVAWAYSSYPRKGFDEAAQLPLTEDEHPGSRADSGSSVI